MAVSNSVAARNAIMDELVSGFNRLALFTGAPVGAGNGQSGTLLATFTLNATPFAAASGGSVSTNAIASVNAVAQGTVGSAVFYNATDAGGTPLSSAPAAGHKRVNLSVSITGGGGDYTMDNPAVESGQQIQANTLTLTAPS